MARSSRVKDVREITTDQLDRTFRVNVHSLFWTVQETLEHMPYDGSFVVTGSINGLRGNKTLIDYSASKAAAMNFAQSMAQVLTERSIRVNCVADDVEVRLVVALAGVHTLNVAEIRTLLVDDVDLPNQRWPHTANHTSSSRGGAVALWRR